MPSSCSTARFTATRTSTPRACSRRRCRCASARGSFSPGQISGVEGYVESVATGWLAGKNAARVARGESPLEAPPKTATGALARYVSGADTKNYQPVNITFALLEPLPEEERRRFKRKRDRHMRQVELALEEWDAWLEHDSGRGARTARRDALSERTFASGLGRALAACACALVLLAASSLALRAQSGRRSALPPIQIGKKGTPTPTPTPTPFNRPTGPIAEPPRPGDPSSQKGKQGGLRPPGTENQPTGSKADEDGVEEGEEVVRISSNLVPLPAIVIDAQGRAVADLKVEDFELRVDGEAKPIGDLSRSETPVSIALLFDNSSSQVSGRDFERQAGIRFLKSVIRPVDRAAVFSISTEPELSHPLTNDVPRLSASSRASRARTRPPPHSSTRSRWPPSTSSRCVRARSSSSSPTAPTPSATSTSTRQSSTLLADDCQVYAVRTGNSDSPNLHDLAGARRLEEFAEQTGGAVYVPRTNDELTAAFKQIATDLSQQYVLSYYPPGEVRDGRFRTFTLNVKTRPNLRVRTRRGYFAPKE